MDKLVQIGKSDYLDSNATRETYGNPVMGIKARHKEAKVQSIKEQEVMKKN